MAKRARTKKKTAAFIATEPKEVLVLVALALLVVVNVGMITQVFGGFTLASYHREQLELAQYDLQEAQSRIVDLEYDRVRIEDATNILLALEEYQFDTEAFPEGLFELIEEEYLPASTRLNDPLSRKPYYYVRSGEGFVLCIWLSDMVKGTNTTQCPDGTTVFDEGFDLDFTEGFDAGAPEVITSLEDIGTEKSAVPTYVIVAVEGVVNVRETPSADADIVARAVEGQRMESLEVSGEWQHVRLNAEIDGWVFAELLREVE